jgi:hypothetical protein
LAKAAVVVFDDLGFRARERVNEASVFGATRELALPFAEKAGTWE